MRHGRPDRGVRPGRRASRRVEARRPAQAAVQAVNRHLEPPGRAGCADIVLHRHQVGRGRTAPYVRRRAGPAAAIRMVDGQRSGGRPSRAHALPCGRRPPATTARWPSRGSGDRPGSACSSRGRTLRRRDGRGCRARSCGTGSPGRPGHERPLAAAGSSSRVPRPRTRPRSLRPDRDHASVHAHPKCAARRLRRRRRYRRRRRCAAGARAGRQQQRQNQPAPGATPGARGTTSRDGPFLQDSVLGADLPSTRFSWSSTTTRWFSTSSRDSHAGARSRRRHVRERPPRARTAAPSAGRPSHG